MSAPEDGLLAAAAEYQRCAADLREVIREGREVIQEMREIHREMETTGREIEKQFAIRLTNVIEPLCAEAVEKIQARFDQRFEESRAWLDGEFVKASRKVATLNDTLAEFQGRDLRLPSVVGNVPAAFQRPSRRQRRGGQR